MRSPSTSSSDDEIGVGVSPPRVPPVRGIKNTREMVRDDSYSGNGKSAVKNVPKQQRLEPKIDAPDLETLVRDLIIERDALLERRDCGAPIDPAENLLQLQAFQDVLQDVMTGIVGAEEFERCMDPAENRPISDVSKQLGQLAILNSNTQKHLVFQLQQIQDVFAKQVDAAVADTLCPTVVTPRPTATPRTGRGSISFHSPREYLASLQNSFDGVPNLTPRLPFETPGSALATPRVSLALSDCPAEVEDQFSYLARKYELTATLLAREMQDHIRTKLDLRDAKDEKNTLVSNIQSLEIDCLEKEELLCEMRRKYEEATNKVADVEMKDQCQVMALEGKLKVLQQEMQNKTKKWAEIQEAHKEREKELVLELNTMQEKVTTSVDAMLDATQQLTGERTPQSSSIWQPSSMKVMHISPITEHLKTLRRKIDDTPNNDLDLLP
eukprot:TRINITY_DN15129_c0_g1_i1.p1 TRINITY_DN15129_c0_g1~~TRINITY_DN15129_c0_g1_i1.p1  ORF type:complete len:440 (+),score=104.33 TRINITY_DN15129_c0_g1_i1:61-1380(+)